MSFSMLRRFSHKSSQNALVLAQALNRKRRDAGFTLIEIMVVIAIIGILATLIVPKIMGRPDEARATAAKHDVGTLAPLANIIDGCCRCGCHDRCRSAAEAMTTQGELLAMNRSK